jgi:hypothetical protein
MDDEMNVAEIEMIIERKKLEIFDRKLKLHDNIMFQKIEEEA